MMFPVLMDSSERKKYPNCPHSVPWELVAPHEEQAMRNHDQTLKRLAERGGLDPCELFCVLEDLTWREAGYGMGFDAVPREKIDAAVAAVIRKVEQHTATKETPQ
jgi:hypothetical protein